jgi:hypothetical protein
MVWSFSLQNSTLGSTANAAQEIVGVAETFVSEATA